MKPVWSAFWNRVMSPQTARFVLALIALGCSAYAANILINQEGSDDAGQAAIFAVGQLFALTTVAFGYYYGSTARNDAGPQETRIVNRKNEPVPIEDEGKD